jgi:uncharacterized protein (TIGR03086 family)
VNPTDDPRPLLARSFEQSVRLVGAVRSEDLGRPTPCTDFDVRALLAHLTFAAERIGAAGRRDTLPTEAPDPGSVADDGWPERFGRAAEAALAAWAPDAALEGEIDLPFGTFPAPVVAAIYAQEQVTHGWDLAAATGQLDRLDPSLAEAILPLVQQFVPADVRGGEMPFGAVVEVPADAGPYARLAGYLGRDPEAA